MNQISVTYEEWLDGDPGWLRVIIERTTTGEILSAFTRPSPAPVVRKLKTDLENGKLAYSKLEFINYYCPATEKCEEINDDLHVYTITGHMEQAAAFGSAQLRFSLDSHSIGSLVAQLLRERSHIDLRLFEFLGAIVPESFALFADELELDPVEVEVQNDSNNLQGLDPQLVLNKQTREAFWGTHKLEMNALSHFDLLDALYEAKGAIVPWLSLLKIIKPEIQISNQVDSQECAPELKGPLYHVRSALRQVESKLDVFAVRKRGCRLGAKKTE